MQLAKSWSEFFPNPFARANPFVLLRAQPGSSPTQLSAAAADRQFLSESSHQQSTFRDALRELTSNPLRRIEWETFTPQAPTPPESANVARAGLLLGEHLSGGRPVAGTLAFLAETLAASIGWERRLARLGDKAPTPQEVAQWWQIATHRHAERWEYWHQLALFYHASALAAEQVFAAHEGECSQGKSSSNPGSIPLDSLWLQAFRCWARTLRTAEFWGTLREHVARSPGFDEAQVELLQSRFPEELVSSLADLLLEAATTGNRLAAARRWRFLTLLSASPGLTPFAEQAAAARERVENRLWMLIHQHEHDPRARLQELTRGLLLLQARKPEVVQAAFEALYEILSSELAFTPGHFPEARQASALLVRHVGLLENRVFDSACGLQPGHSQKDATLLVLFYGLRLQASLSGELLPGEPISKYDLRRKLLQAKDD